MLPWLRRFVDNRPTQNNASETTRCDSAPSVFDGILLRRHHSMKSIVFGICCLSVCGVIARGSAGVDAAEPGRPNIVLVLIDDMGWGDFSCFGNRAARTPNVDRLAREGLRFTQFYVNAPICSPSRCAFTTGQYPHRWRITSYLNNRQDNVRRGVADWLDPNAPTLPRILRDNGYATGHFGKCTLAGSATSTTRRRSARTGSTSR